MVISLNHSVHSNLNCLLDGVALVRYLFRRKFFILFRFDIKIIIAGGRNVKSSVTTNINFTNNLSTNQ